MEPPARGAFHDLGSLILGEKAQQIQRQLALRCLLVVLAADREFLAALGQLANDDGLVRSFAGDAISVVKINPVEKIGFRILSSLF